jgi:DNA-binding CsgD family transcriptional regulator
MLSRSRHYNTRYKHDLTPRQRQVLDRIARGHTNAEIAADLDLTLDGAKWHVSEILSKLALDSREEAAEYWRSYNRPLSRVSRSMSGLASFGALKVMALGGGLVAVAGVPFVLVVLLGESETLVTAPNQPSAAVCGAKDLELRITPQKSGSDSLILAEAHFLRPCEPGGFTLELVDSNTGKPAPVDGNEATIIPSPTVQVDPGGWLPIGLPMHWSNYCLSGDSFTAIGRMAGLEVRSQVTAPPCVEPGSPTTLGPGNSLRGGHPQVLQLAAQLDEAVRTGDPKAVLSIAGGLVSTYQFFPAGAEPSLHSASEIEALLRQFLGPSLARASAGCHTNAADCSSFIITFASNDPSRPPIYFAFGRPDPYSRPSLTGFGTIGPGMETMLSSGAAQTVIGDTFFAIISKTDAHLAPATAWTAP